MHTLTVTLADLEGVTHGTTAAHTSVKVSARYSREVILTDGTIIPPVIKNAAIPGDGVAAFEVYESDSPDVDPDYQGFAIVVTATVSHGHEAGGTYRRTVSVSTASPDPVSLGSLPSATGSPSPSWQAITDARLDALEAGGGGGGGGAVDSVNGQTGTVTLDAADVGAATAAQGALADTAVQPADLDAYATTGIPIFETQSEAQDYEASNPGKIALWFDGPTHVTATAPTFTDASGTANDTYTIPAATGVDYSVGGTVTTAGTYPASGTVSIAAAAQAGYALDGTTSWSHTYSTATDPTHVTASGPTWTDDTVNGGGSWTTPTEAGITYSPASGTATPSQEVTVTASAQSGYIIDGTTSWSHTFPASTGSTPGITNFGSDTLGQPPAGWTTPWSTTGVDWSVISDAGAVDGKALSVGSSDSSRNGYAWTGIDVPTASQADVEVLWKYWLSSNTASEIESLRLVLRGAGSAGSETGLYLNQGISAATLWVYDNGQATAVSAYSGVPTVGGGSQSWRMVRVRVEGSTFKVKAWAHGSAEPSSWDYETTAVPASNLAPGWVGFLSNNGQKVYHVDWLSVATGGATATDPES